MLTKTVLWDSDLETTLSARSVSLRNTAHAVMGLAHEQFREGEPAFQALEGVSLMLEQEAKVVEAVSDILCQTCALSPVREEILLGAVGRRPVRKRQPTKKPKGLW